MNERPDKIMTPEEYAALNIKGWHRVCKDVDGFGAVGVIYQQECAHPWASQDEIGRPYCAGCGLPWADVRASEKLR